MSKKVDAAKAVKKCKKASRKGRRGWVIVNVQHDCGCCHSEMYFQSEASAKKTWMEAGLMLSATMKDDQGTVFEGIDTFYGMVKV